MVLMTLLFGSVSGPGTRFEAEAAPVPAPAPAAAPCRVDVVDAESGWPVPMVELRTTHHLRFVSDNAGCLALDAPELMGREVWFDVIGHGYGVPADRFGYRGVRLRPVPAGRLRVEVRRTAIARRLGRLTGAGLFAESVKLGLDAGLPETGVFGCDSVQNAVHDGRHFWAWGDTTLAGYPLGLFHMTSATTPLKPLASFEPPLRLAFGHFRDAEGRVRDVAKMPGEGPTWLGGYASLPDREGRARLVATYQKIRPPLESYEVGLCVWNDTREVFERLKVLWTKSDASPRPPPFPDGHPVRWQDADGGDWVLFGNPLPTLRCAARFEAWQDPAAWTPLTPPEELESINAPERVKLHSGSMAWNAYRARWVTVFMQALGKPSAFGELWYAEARDPRGPWGRAVKVLTHENYTFYNPRLHPEFTPPESPVLLFEGTFTQQFADRPPVTPRHDYNQVLYRLDLDDPALRAARVE